MTYRKKYLLACHYLVKQLTEKDVNAVVMGDLIVKWRDVLNWIEQELEIEDDNN